MSTATTVEKRENLTSMIRYESPYVSPILTDEDRERLQKACGESHRTTYYDLTPEEVHLRNEWTLENFVFCVEVLDWSTCVNRLGLELAKITVTYATDDEGEVIVDEEGNKEVLSKDVGEYRFSCPVKVEGLVDINDEPIPVRNSVQFNCTKEPTNRPLNATNYSHIQPRFEKWAINGETLIKDAIENGQSEQHRLVARVVQMLAGDALPNDDFVKSFTIDGIHPDIAITIDTGKPNSGKDIFGSDPEIVPPTILKTPQSYLGTTESGEVEYLEKRTEERTRVCGATESAAKLLLLRGGAKNVNASYPGGANHATEVAHIFASRVIPDLDDLAAMVHVFIGPIKSTERPCTVPELTAAIALYQLREIEPIDTLHYAGVGPGRDDVNWGTPLMEVKGIHLDMEEPLALLRELGGAESKLANWSKARTSDVRKKESKVLKFAKLCWMIQQFYEGEELGSDDLKNEIIGGPQTAAKFLHYGGFDRGPLPKKNKSE